MIHHDTTSIQFPQLDLKRIRLVSYSNAAFANNHDLSSQLRLVVLVMDNNDNAVPISFRSYKLRSVTRSILYPEVIAFADMIDEASSIRS